MTTNLRERGPDRLKWLLVSLLLTGIWECEKKPRTHSGFISIADSKIYYNRTGQGDPVILLHGGLMNTGMWDDQVTFLSRDFTVITVDMRGHGRTVDGDSSYYMHEAIRILADTLSLADFYIVGHSIGGQVATDFALDYPEYVKGLILESPSIGQFEGSVPDPELENKILLMQKALIAEKDTVTAANLYVQAWFDGPSRPQSELDSIKRQKALEMALGTLKTHKFKHWPRTSSNLVSSRLKNLRVPVLLIEGESDFVSLHRIADSLQTLVPGLQRQVIKNAAHMSNLERSSEFNEVLSRFMKSN